MPLPICHPTRTKISCPPSRRSLPGRGRTPCPSDALFPLVRSSVSTRKRSLPWRLFPRPPLLPSDPRLRHSRPLPRPCLRSPSWIPSDPPPRAHNLDHLDQPHLFITMTPLPHRILCVPSPPLSADVYLFWISLACSAPRQLLTQPAQHLHPLPLPSRIPPLTSLRLLCPRRLPWRGGPPNLLQGLVGQRLVQVTTTMRKKTMVKYSPPHPSAW